MLSHAADLKAISRVKWIESYRSWFIGGFLLMCIYFISMTVIMIGKVLPYFQILDEWDRPIFEIGFGSGLLAGIAFVAILFCMCYCIALLCDARKDRLLIRYAEERQT